MLERALEGDPVVAVDAEGVETIFPGEIDEMLGAAIFVPVTVAEEAEPCVEGTPAVVDTLVLVASPVLNVPVDTAVL